MSRWEMVKLGDVCKITSGGTPNRKYPEYFGGFIPWVKTGDLKQKYIDLPEEFISEEGLKNSSAKLFPKGTVLIALYGATIGACSILNIESTTNQACGALLPTTDAKPEYLYYFLLSNRPKFISQGVGGAQPNISGGILKETPIPLPPLPEQQRIVARLDKAQQLIDQRKEQLALMDALVQSLFYEMFGDPVKNEKGWDEKSVSSVCSSIMGGGTPSKSNPDYYTGSIPWVTPKDMKVIWINNSIDKVTENAISSSSAKLIETGSVLMVIRSGILKNKLPVAINTVPVTLNQDMKAFVPKKDLLKAEFLLYIFNFFQPVLLGKVRAVTADNIEFSQIKDLLIPIPPLPLQQAFADRVQQIEALKQSMTASLRELEHNFQALMQEAFGG